MKVVLHPEAEAEVDQAATWYEKQRASLGGDFHTEVATALGRIRDSPDSHPRLRGIRVLPPIRRAFLKRFPYTVIFERYAQNVLVLAVAHARRRPRYWLSRRSSTQER